MNIIEIAILLFVIIESLNVLMLYFMPGSKMGNGVGVFNAWHKLQDDDEQKDFINYMTSWVAGAKLIFIMLGIAIIIWGTIELQIATAAAMVISIASFFYRLYPLIKKMDNNGQISPKGYSKTLLGMITAFIVAFLAVFVIGIIIYL